MTVRSRILVALAVVAALGAGTASAGGAAPTCKARQLHGKLLDSSGAAGTIVLSVTLTNTGAYCSLDGYAHLRLMANARTPLPTRVLHGGLAILDQKPKRVLLAHGGAATIWIAYSDVPTGYETRCPTSPEILVAPPGDATWIAVLARTKACNRGTLRESPVMLGRRHAP
jgi:hypothetical protein